LVQSRLAHNKLENAVERVSENNKKSAVSKKIEPNSVYKTKYVSALIRLSLDPQTKMIKNIGISKLSKNKQKKNKSKDVNVRIRNNSIASKFINKNFLFLIFQLAKIQNGKIIIVKTKNKKEIPSNPNETLSVR